MPPPVDLFLDLVIRDFLVDKYSMFDLGVIIYKNSNVHLLYPIHSERTLNLFFLFGGLILNPGPIGDGETTDNIQLPGRCHTSPPHSI